MGDRRLDASQRLLHLAEFLVNAKQYVQAALVLQSAATSSGSSLTPSARAAALTAAGRFLLRAGGAAHAARARPLLHKAVFILDACPGCEALRLEAGALLETASEGGAAAQAIRVCLDLLTRRAGQVEGWMSWWVYFKGREVFLCEPKQAAVVASAAAAEAAENDDLVAAAAFQLMIAQIDLGFVACDGGQSQGQPADRPCGKVEQALCEAGEFLNRADGSASAADLASLRICCAALHALYLFRLGRVADSRVHVEALDAACKSARAMPPRKGGSPQWKWLNVKVLRALVCHILASSMRSTYGSPAATKQADKALAWAGLAPDEERSSAMRPFGGKLNSHAELAFAVVLLESAARMKLSVVDLEGAAPLIRSALALVQDPRPGLSLATQASVYLLTAEYLVLRGTKSSAQRATLYLARILDTADSGGADTVELGDVAHMGRTYNSLLTGNRRFDSVDLAQGGGRNVDGKDDEDPTAGGAFTSAHVRSAALFAEGVQQMRQANVLDAKRTLMRAYKLAGCGVHGENDQLLTNIGTTLSSLFVSHSNVSENNDEIVEAVLNVSNASGDLVTHARTLRMRRKLISRAEGMSPDDLALVENEQTKNEGMLRQRQISSVRL